MKRKCIFEHADDDKMEDKQKMGTTIDKHSCGQSLRILLHHPERDD